MAGAKNTNVLLEVNHPTGVHLEQEFCFADAERLLRMKRNGGWALPKDSKYEYTKEYGLRVRTDSNRDKGEQKGSRNSKGKSTPEQD